MAGTLQDNYRRQNRDGLYFGITLPTLAAIVVLTAITVEVSRPFLDMEIAMHPSPSDIPVNILLYVPLGIALGGRRLWKVLVIAGLLSVTAEFLQFFYPDRYPSLFDVVANVTGGAVGVAVARIFRRAGWIDLSEIRGNEIIGLAALFACATLILVMSKTGRRTDFSNWDPGLPLAVGQELGHGNTWDGEIRGMAITADPLSIHDIRSLIAGGETMPQLGAVADQVLYRLPHPMGQNDPAWGTPLLDPQANKRLFESLRDRGTLTILLWFRAADPHVIGLWPIVSSSRNNRLRNFTLGQEGARIELLLRTPLSGRSAFYPHINTLPIVEPGKEIFLAATYDGRVARVYRDGRLTGRVNLSSLCWRIGFLADAGLPAAGTIAGMLAGVAVLCLGGDAMRRRKWLTAAIAGILAGLGLLLVGATGAVPAFKVWVPVFGLGGALVIAASATVHQKQP